MRTRSFYFVVALVTLIAVPAVALSGGTTAFACSCLFPGTAEAIAESDAVFTGSLVSQAGSIEEPLWTFAVDGVVHGDVGPTVEVRGGAIDGAGCGPNFAGLDGPITIFADATDDGLQTSGCRPSPPATQFESELAALSVPAIDPAGVGPPAAVMAGVQGPYDLSLLDAQGRAVARAHVGAYGRSVAHCPGTPRVALSPRHNLHTVVIVDLTTMETLDERPSDGPAVSTFLDRMACLDGGDRVITAVADYNGGDVVDVTVSNSVGSGRGDVTRRFDGTTRAVIADTGIVFLIPTAPAGSIRTVAVDDLTPAAEDVALPEGTAAVDADISPDGQTLAVLTTTGTGSTMVVNVITFDLTGGVIDPASAPVTQSIPRGTGTIPSRAQPTALRWTNSDSWLVEFGTLEESYVANDRYLVVVSTDGTESAPPTAAGKSRGLVSIDGGVLSARLNGAELIGSDGNATALYPPPNETGTIDFLTFFDFDSLTDVPAFEPPSPANAPVTVGPVDPNAPPVTYPTPTEPNGTRQPNEPSAPTQQTGVAAEGPNDAQSAASDSSRPVGLIAAAVGAAAIVFAVMVLAGVAARSRHRQTTDDDHVE